MLKIEKAEHVKDRKSGTC